MEINIRIIVEHAPVGVLYALQEGSGSFYKTLQPQRAAKTPLVFEFAIIATGDMRKDPNPDFKGAVVQGPRGSRFVYLDIGTAAGDVGSPWTRRLKIPLTGISWSMLKTNSAEKIILETHVEGTGKDQGPSCGTVKPFSGWKTVP